MSLGVQAQLLKSGDGEIYCVVSQPAENCVVSAVVLLVPPLGQMYYRCHGLYRQMEHRLVGQGQAVFRIDFRGQGDSSGNFEQISEQSLLQDLLSVYVAIRTQFPLLPLWMVGTDWSVVPVLRWLVQHSQTTKVWGMIMAEPVLDGAEYWHQQLTWQQAILKEPSRFSKPRQMEHNQSTVEIAGHCYHHDWVQQIQHTNAYEDLAGLIVKHRVCVAGEQRLTPIKNYLSNYQHPRIQDHFIELTSPPQWLEAARLDQSVRHPQWLNVITQTIAQLR